MPTDYTQNYQLSQWERTDKVQMDDFNADNAKIDAALAAQAEAHAALEAKCGNVTIGVFTYTGSGTFGEAHPTRITFPKMPAFFIILGYSLFLGQGGAELGIVSYESSGYGHTHAARMSWSGNSFTLVNSSAKVQMNENTTYTVLCFYTAE